MEADDRARVRADLMRTLDWPVTTGEVQGAAPAVDDRWRDDFVVAARRLPDDGHWLDIDQLWQDLDPLLEDVAHG